MFLKLENFRRFYKPLRAHIAPITVLLGENSSGKTSFAAGLRYVIDSMSARGEGSFNREPFFLGAFDQISHYRGGRYGRSSSFSLAVHIDKDEMARFTKQKSGFLLHHSRSVSYLDVKLTFENAQSQPTLSQVALGNEFVQVEMKKSDLPQFRLRRADEQRFNSVGSLHDQVLFQPSNSLVDRNSLSPFYVTLQNYQFNARRSSTDKAKIDADIARAEALDRATLGTYLFSDETIYASAPFRTRPERTYSPVEASSSAEGAHIPILLAQAKAFEKDRWQQIKERLEQFGTKSKMFKKVDVKRMGRNQSDPFQIIITVSKDHSNLIDVGYGVSQVLPLLVETLMNQSAFFFIFQQPEVHLHPRAQAELGSYFLDFVATTEKFVILETHSDFMIDRIRSEITQRGLNVSEYLSVLFFERDDFETNIHKIEFDESGNVVNPPDGYRSFFINEAARNLGL